MHPTPVHLTPLQRRTLDALRRAPEPVVFDREFVAELTEEARNALATLGERVGDHQLVVHKRLLSAIFGCEAQAVENEPFTWNPQLAHGQVAHRAIQLLLTWRGEPAPLDLVDDAVARLVDEDTSLGNWLAGLSGADEADLRGFAVDRVTKFMECFPPLDPRSHPTTESRIRWPADGPVVLAGKVDLVMGRGVGDESRKVLVDLKSGRTSPQHRDDLRFYALVETLRTGLPPRKVASFYLDAGHADVEDVTESVLRTAMRRTLDGVRTIVELTVEGRDPVKRPGPACRWCPLRGECDEGRAFLDADDTDW